jgi:plastocyanin
VKVARLFSGRSVRLGAVGALTALALLAPGSVAQNGESPHPAHIHSGTCAELGDVVFPLTDVAGSADDAERSGAESAIPLESSDTIVDIPLQELIDGGHAINVHLSAEDIGTYIACGDIGGVVSDREGSTEGEAELDIALGELNDSGYVGTVWLGAEGNATLVQILLFNADSQMAVPDATPAASTDASADELMVTIEDFKFQPPTIEVPVGGSVTWTNRDASPHTATGIDREALQSGTLRTDESYTQQFDTAGTFDYFCEFHAGMKGTVVVE